MSIKPLHHGQTTTIQRVGQQVQVRAIKMIRGHTVEHGADVIVSGDTLEVEQGMGIGADMTLLQGPLEGKERGTLGKEDGKGRHADVGHGVFGVAAASLVGQRSAALSDQIKMFVEDVHPRHRISDLVICESPGGNLLHIFAKICAEMPKLELLVKLAKTEVVELRDTVTTTEALQRAPWNDETTGYTRIDTQPLQDPRNGVSST